MVRKTSGRRVRVLSALACAWLLLAAGCGGGGGGGSEQDATPSSLSAAVVTTSLDAYPTMSTRSSINGIADGYFPLSQGDSWVYDDTVDGSTTVGGLTRTVIRGPDASGQIELQELEDTDTSTERYIASSAGLTQLDPFDAATAIPAIYKDFPSWLRFPNIDQKVGAVLTVDRAGTTQADFDGDGKPDAYRLHAEQVFKGFKTANVLGIATPVAHFVATYVLEFRYSADNSRAKFTFVMSEAYAQGLGLVLTERVIVKDGTVQLHQSLALRAARVGGVDHGVSSAQLDKTGIAHIVPSIGGINPQADYNKASVTVTLNRPGDVVRASATTLGIYSVSTASVDATHVRVDLLFNSAASLGQGTFNDTLTITVCADRACRLSSAGSPFAVPVSTIVGMTQAPESGVTPLAPLRQQALTHDVVAAKYSRSLDRVVMVSGSPDNRLYLLTPSTGQEQSVALSRAPTSLTLSPDGSEAAVGHDGRVTWVKLATVGLPQPESKQLDLSAKASGLALDNARHVYAMPAAPDQWTSIHTIDVDTNTEAAGAYSGKVYGGDSIVVRPDGRTLFTQFIHLSTRSVHEWSLQSGAPVFVGETDPTAFGENLCGGPLWLSNDGNRLVTACGLIINALPGSSKDGTYNATLPLTRQGQGSSAYRLVDLNQSATGSQWAALEFAWYDCGGTVNGGCFHHLNVYDDDTFVLREKWALGAVAMAGLAYDQEGVAVFHSADSQHLYLITHLRGMGNAASAYLFQVVR